MFRRFTFVALLACAVLAASACSRGGNDAHYAELEKQRQEQAAQPASSATTPSPSASPSPGQTPAETARNYWTNFRGPKRDGKYEEATISTNWPANGLPVLWKQPVGIGHASFVVADGKAYTIEQRRSQEVVAAYDMNNGRELWTQK